MTQSGQGEEPSARPAREGIVLPSDGGEPLLPGMTGDRTTPAGGQAWGQPWGPDQPAAPAPQPDQGWGAPVDGTQTWGAAEPPRSTAPEWGAPDASQGWAPQQQPDANGYQQQTGPHGAQQPQGFAPQAAPGAGPLPPEGAQGPSYGAQNGFAPEAHGTHAGRVRRVRRPGPAGGAAPARRERPPAGRAGSVRRRRTVGPLALPAAGRAADAAAARECGAAAAARRGRRDPVHPVHPARPGRRRGATQYIPPVAATVDEGATQYIPPVGPGALPPEVSAEATQFLGQAPQGGAAGPLPAAAHPDAEATQYIAPVPPQPAGAPYGIRPGAPEDRQPPAEFDSLFRSEPEGPASTQQMPRFDPSAQEPPYGAQAPYGAQPSQGAPGAYGAQAPYGAHAPARRGPGRRTARRSVRR